MFNNSNRLLIKTSTRLHKFVERTNSTLAIPIYLINQHRPSLPLFLFFIYIHPSTPAYVTSQYSVGFPPSTSSRQVSKGTVSEEFHSHVIFPSSVLFLLPSTWTGYQYQATKYMKSCFIAICMQKRIERGGEI